VRVLIAQRSLSPPGGGNAVAAWMIDALARDHQVATITEREWSVDTTNTFYGTSIPHGRVIQHVSGAPWRWLSAFHEDRLTRLRMCAVLRGVRNLASQHDLLVSADNFAPFTSPGLQYVHFPARLQPTPAKMRAFVHPYFWCCERVLGLPWSIATHNRTLVNSHWTAAGLVALGELSTPSVLYPPVIDPGAGLPWHQRENRFLCVGRFHGSKRIELAMAIVEHTRAHSLPDATLLVVGTPVDAEYTSRIRRLAAGYPHVEFREDLSRDELNAVMGRSRFAIQAMEKEHFGMATAELTRAGCLVFAHNSGGSPEVLNHEAALLWSSEEEAHRKIAAVAAMDPTALRDRLRTHT
jgi:glycosyltransferase involved in cell wall biosynthesis